MKTNKPMSMGVQRLLTVLGFIVVCALIMFMLSSCSCNDKQTVINSTQFVDDLNSFDSTAVLNVSNVNGGNLVFIIEQNDSLFSYVVENDEVSRALYVNMVPGKPIR